MYGFLDVSPNKKPFVRCVERRVQDTVEGLEYRGYAQEALALLDKAQTHLKDQKESLQDHLRRTACSTRYI